MLGKVYVVVVRGKVVAVYADRTNAEAEVKRLRSIDQGLAVQPRMVSVQAHVLR